MADFKTIETQDELNAIVGERVASAKNSVRKEFEGYISPEQFKEKTKDLSSDIAGKEETIKALTEERDGLKSQIEEKDKSIAQYENDSVKRKVANELGLSYEAVSYIQGNDEESIRASAEGLKKVVGNQTTPLAQLGGTVPRDTPEQNERNAYKTMLGGMFNND